MSVETIPSDNVCEGCPALKAIQERVEWAETKISCEADRISYLEGYEARLLALNESAGEIACRRLVKVLPDPGTEVPPIGLQWHAFASECPAYQATNK